MFKIEKHNIPSVLSEMFVNNSATHTYFTRQSYYLHVPIIKAATLQKTILYTGVTIWNYLLNKFSNNCTITTTPFEKIYCINWKKTYSIYSCDCDLFCVYFVSSSWSWCVMRAHHVCGVGQGGWGWLPWFGPKLTWCWTTTIYDVDPTLSCHWLYSMYGVCLVRPCSIRTDLKSV